MRPRVATASRALAAGGLAVYPTDTLLGLAADATDARAVERLGRTKGRPDGMPISVAVSSVPEAESFARLSPAARRFLRTHLPGPYTVLVRPSPLAVRRLVPGLFASDGTLGLRVPDHAVARELSRAVGPITATSANRHGEPPTTTVREARRRFGTDVSVYLADGPSPSGSPSRLIDLTGEVPRPVPRSRSP